MSTALIWVVIPLAFGLSMFLLSIKPKLATLLSAFIAFLLAVLAKLPTQGLEFVFGSLAFTLDESFTILGRSLTIQAADLNFIFLIYLLTTIWLIGSLWFKLSKFFPAIILLGATLLVAALSVEPFLYAALLIEIFVMITIPLLSPASERTHRGVMRYMVLISLAIPFILIAGWLLSGIDTAPANSPLIFQATLALFIGFALLLAVIPFHSWIPMISETAHPWVTSFVFTLLPTTIFMLLLSFIDRYAWLRTLPALFPTLKWIGTLMIALGGVFIAFQKNLGKAFGYGVIIENGFFLLAIGLTSQGGLDWVSLLILPRTIAYWLWASCLAYIKTKYNTLEIDSLASLMYSHPFVGTGLIIAQVSIAGIPMLASFPVKRLIWFSAGQPELINSLWMFLGTIGLFILSLRVLIQFLHSDGPQTKWSYLESAGVIIPIILLVALIIIFGLLPQVLNSGVTTIMDAFPRIYFAP